MKKTLIAGIIVVMVLSLCAVFAGNGAPNGQHHNLNIIGVPNPKNVNFDGGEGSRIFVLRTGSTRFYVHGGDNYAILDHDGTDGTVGTGLTDPGITFPYDTETGKWQVDIYLRLVGPKSNDNTLDWDSSYWDGVDTWVPFASFTLDKSSKFSLRTSQLLLDGYQDILWTLEPGTKFRICQMRIYLVER